MTMEKEKISQVNFKMPEKDKKEVTTIFKYYGLDLSTGIKMYLKEVQHTKNIPLTLKPVTELDRAIAEADRGDFAGEFDSLEDFNEAFDKEIKNENYPMDEVKKCVAAIVKNDKKFLVEHKDHSLSKNVRELHIDRQYNDDWLMYYRFNKKTKQLELILHNN